MRRPQTSLTVRKLRTPMNLQAVEAVKATGRIHKHLDVHTY